MLIHNTVTKQLLHLSLQIFCPNNIISQNDSFYPKKLYPSIKENTHSNILMNRPKVKQKILCYQNFIFIGIESGELDSLDYE
ncbi:hypothetical protein [Filifactor alocis]|uniref:hypothetical protein n=1 Tax=Filifactor alocis TaxID=143361 RepID=UPI0028E87190|nr:hypothetical protein [Filifactor alocis]